FARNLSGKQGAKTPAQLVASDPDWPEQAGRIVHRLQTPSGHRPPRTHQNGSTAVAGFEAKAVIDIQITVESLDVADELAEPLLAAGYPRLDPITSDAPQKHGRTNVVRS